MNAIVKSMTENLVSFVRLRIDGPPLVASRERQRVDGLFLDNCETAGLNRSSIQPQHPAHRRQINGERDGDQSDNNLPTASSLPPAWTSLSTRQRILSSVLH